MTPAAFLIACATAIPAVAVVSALVTVLWGEWYWLPRIAGEG